MVTRKSACVHCVAVYMVKVICWVAPTGRNDPVIEVSVTPEGSSKSKQALFTIYNYRDLIFQHPSDPQRSHSVGAVVENLPANAGDTGSSPGLGRSHRPRSNWAREPQLLSLSVWSLCSATREGAIVRGLHAAMKSGPHLPQLEKALAQKRRPNTAKNKNN